MAREAVLRKQVRVFLDTNVLIEAFRIGIWPIIGQNFSLETVEKCIEEALTGDPGSRGYVRIDPKRLKGGLHCIHRVDKLMLSDLMISHPYCAGLDDGELHLFAWLYAKARNGSDQLLISTADKAAIYAANQLAWLDSVVSLQELASSAGVNRRQTNLLAAHHKTKWLENLKTTIRLTPNAKLH